jgi:hypothetical protein
VEGQEEVVRKKKNKTLRGEARRQNLRELLVWRERDRGGGNTRSSRKRREKMRKRERENPCFVCGHYHKFEDGEVCGICGHRQKEATEKGPQQSAFSNEILPQFLYLGSYDNASRAELLKAQGISRILNVHIHTHACMMMLCSCRLCVAFR